MQFAKEYKIYNKSVGYHTQTGSCTPSQLIRSGQMYDRWWLLLVVGGGMVYRQSSWFSSGNILHETPSIAPDFKMIWARMVTIVTRGLVHHISSSET